MIRSFYDVLQVSQAADSRVIRAAWRMLSQIHHPDKGGSVEHMQEINEAYETLINSKRRTGYDLWLRSRMNELEEKPEENSERLEGRPRVFHRNWWITYGVIISITAFFAIDEYDKMPSFSYRVIFTYAIVCILWVMLHDIKIARFDAWVSKCKSEEAKFSRSKGSK